MKPHRYVIDIRIFHEGEVLYEISTPVDSVCEPGDTGNLLVDLTPRVYDAMVTMIRHHAATLPDEGGE